jgi:hypothetical protein
MSFDMTILILSEYFSSELDLGKSTSFRPSNWLVSSENEQRRKIRIMVNISIIDVSINFGGANFERLLLTLSLDTMVPLLPVITPTMPIRRHLGKEHPVRNFGPDP